MTMTDNTAQPTGNLGLRVIKGGASHAIDPYPEWPTLSHSSVVEYGLPRLGLSEEVNRFRAANVKNLWRGYWRWAVAEACGICHATGVLWMNKIKGDGTVVPLGLASMRVVTDTGVAYIVDAFQNLTELENMKYHGYGTGTTAEAASQTALVTETLTQYVGDVRPTGSLAEAANNIFRTVATFTPDSGGSAIVLREHGIFSASTAGVMLDRTLFAAVTLDATAGDSLQTTYELTFPSGG